LIAGLSCGSPPAIAAGEFVLGLRDESGSISGKNLPAWTRNGSFVAFLQLQQHVEVFWRAMRQHAQVFGVCPQELASRVIGRKRDAVGTPLSDPPSRYSHIGRAYSRWLGPSESSRHRILRRGIPYGAPWKEGEPDDGQRGMLFVAYQSDIARQFEYVWTRWLNGADHPTAGAGRDGLTGQSVQPDRATPVPMWSSRSLRPVSVESPTHGRVSVPIALPVFVTPQSSGYFFAPSISGLCVLAETAAGKGTNQHVKGPA
jgi:Dyp-type peroxidase family